MEGKRVNYDHHITVLYVPRFGATKALQSSVGRSRWYAEA